MKKRPDILFVFSDQQHWQAFGCNDASFTTPNLDRLLAGSTLFTHAFCTTPQCSPSRSSMLTGLYPSKTGVLGNIGQRGGDPLRMRTIGAMLQEAGYRTAYFGKWHLGKDPVGVAGWDEELGVAGPECHDDGEVTRHAVDFLARHKDGERPIALFLSYLNPHDIYRFKRDADLSRAPVVSLPESWRRKDLSTTPAVQRQFMEEDQGRALAGAEPSLWQHYREFYREKVAQYDRELGQVLDALDARGTFDDTLIIATSDHGDMDGQHGLALKGPFMYEHMMRVPLIVRLPDAVGSPRVSAKSDFLTVNVDLVPTILDLAGLPLPPTDGLSLLPLLTGQGALPQRDTVIGQYYSKQNWVNPIRMVRTRRHKYTLYRTHGEELYDLERDPDEICNVAAHPEYAAIKARLVAALEQWMKENADPFHAQRCTTRTGEPLAEESSS